MNESNDKARMVVTESGLSVPDGYQHEDVVCKQLRPTEVETRTPAPRFYAWVIPASKQVTMWQIGRVAGYTSLVELKEHLQVSIGHHKYHGATVMVLRADLATVL